MTRLALLIPLVLVPACGDDDCCTGVVIDAARQDSGGPSEVPGTCATAGRDKIKFNRSQSCANDGSVEWCIPNESGSVTLMFTISPTIHCAAGGGRAGCNIPGLLLCSYPTTYPDQCTSPGGEMAPAVWDDMCELAALSQITAIVPTILE